MDKAVAVREEGVSYEEVAPMIYVAGPYGDRGGYMAIDKNIAVAREAAVWLVKNGFFFLCPHLNSAHFEAITPEVSIEHWYGQDLRLMEACDAMIVVGEWAKSKGVNKELQVAGAKGMPIFDFTDETGKSELLEWRDEWVARKLAAQIIGLRQDIADAGADDIEINIV